MDLLTYPPSDLLLSGEKPDVLPDASQRSSAAMTLKDPIATHLLVETALADAKTFQVLSYEELDALKKEGDLLAKRIDGLRRKLQLETKVRDAARNVRRLYERGSGASRDSVQQERARVELQESEAKVDSVAKLLYTSQERATAVQMTLLQHTAAVLTTTYGNGHRPRMDVYGLPGARPYSPDSLDNWEKRLEEDDAERDGDASRDLDGFLDQLHRDSRSKDKADASVKSKEMQQAIGQRLGELNDFVRDIIGQVNPKNNMANSAPPKPAPDARGVDATIFEQLTFLSRGLDEIKSEQRNIRMSRSLKSVPPTPTLQNANAQLRTELETSLQENVTLQREYDMAEAKMASMLQELNLRIVDVLTTSSPDDPVPSVPDSGSGPSAQITFAKDRIGVITRLIGSLTEAAQRSRSTSTSNDRTAQYEVVLSGLWQIILAGEDDARQRKREEREALTQRRAAVADVDSEDDVSPDEDDGLPDEFSLSAFSTKVQFLVSKTSYLKEKQADLRRRMRQMRDAYDQRDAVGQTETAKTTAELTRVTELYAVSKEELRDVESKLAKAESRSLDLEQQVADASSRARDQSESALADLQQKMTATEQRAQELDQKLTEAMQAREGAVAKASKLETEMQNLEGEVVRLTTELTICKAELDAAFGSRAQRAEEAAKAASSESSAKIEQLQAEIAALKEESSKATDTAAGASQREQALKTELEATLKEFEELTKASVEAEREREELESTLDKLRDTVEGLESEVAEAKIGAMGAGEGASTSAVVLRNEFKKMMRDAREESRKALRAEQEERRKVETQLRALRKDQAGPAAKSLLGRVLAR